MEGIKVTLAIFGPLLIALAGVFIYYFATKSKDEPPQGRALR
jgi:hypothetical protein